MRFAIVSAAMLVCSTAFHLAHKLQPDVVVEEIPAHIVIGTVLSAVIAALGDYAEYQQRAKGNTNEQHQQQ